MTKKDYEVIAKAIKYVKLNDNKVDIWNLIDSLSIEFKADNPKFNKSIFIKACGLNEEER